MKSSLIVATAALWFASHAFGAAPSANLLQTFVKPAPRDFARFGQGIAGVGEKVLIGGEQFGAAYIFDISSGGLVMTLPSPVPGNSDGFGFSAAGTPTRAYVGAVIDSTVVNRAGAVYAFDTSNGSLVRTFRAPVPMDNRRFGYAVAVQGNRLLVGQNAPGAPAYLFDANSGSLLLTLNNPASGVANAFGAAVRFVGNNLLVGAPASEFGTLMGRAYLFNGSTGTLLRTFQAPMAGTAGNGFGYSVAEWNGKILIGAPYDDKFSSNGGAAYVFDPATGAILDLYSNPSGSGSNFGAAVASASGNALIAAKGSIDNNDGGAVFAFGPSHGLRQVALNPRPGASTAFGLTPFGIVGENFVIGAWADSSEGITAGIAYAFQGPTFVPEPSSLVLFILAAIAIPFAHNR